MRHHPWDQRERSSSAAVATRCRWPLLPAKEGRTRRGSGAALSLLLLPALWILSACLVPQPIEEAPAKDPFANQPPRIVQRTPAGSVQRTQRGCERIALSLDAIEDLDPEDDLEVRWFVNYQLGRWDPVRVNLIRAEARSQDGIPFPARDSFTLSFDQFRDETLVVEAVVSDGFDDDPDREPAHRAVQRGKTFAEVGWTILVESVQECLP